MSKVTVIPKAKTKDIVAEELRYMPYSDLRHIMAKSSPETIKKIARCVHGAIYQLIDIHCK